MVLTLELCTVQSAEWPWGWLSH